MSIYKPRGENLDYYDVNSLYPFVMKMKEFPLPIGNGTWHGNLSEHKLEDLFGFIEAFVSCPPSIRNPLLPYRDQDSDVLLFPSLIEKDKGERTPIDKVNN